MESLSHWSEEKPDGFCLRSMEKDIIHSHGLSMRRRLREVDAFENSWGGSGDSVLWINTSFPSAQLITSAFFFLFFDGKNNIQAIVVLLVTIAERLTGKMHKPGITGGLSYTLG